LDIHSGGITLNSGAGAVTFGTPSRTIAVGLDASQTWLNNSSSLLSFATSGSGDDSVLALRGSTLTIDGTGNTTINANGITSTTLTASDLAFIKKGTGVLTVAAALKASPTVSNATFVGDVRIEGGTLRYGLAGALPSAADVIFNTASGAATLDLNNFNGTIASLTINGAAGTSAAVTTGAGTLTLGGNVFYNNALGTPNGATISGNLDLGATTRTFEIRDSGVAEELLVSAVVSGSGGLTKTSTGQMTLSGPNTFTGDVVVREGVLSTNTLANLGADSSIGAGTTGVVQLGFGTRTGTLQYTGPTDTSTNRQIQLGRNGGAAANAEASGAVIENTGTGQLTFSNADFNAVLAGVTSSRNLTLQGNNTDLNTISGIIRDNDTGTGGLVALVKEDTGTWVLAGVNVYNGDTTINGGTLVLGVNSALASTTDIELGTATIDLANSTTNSVSTLDVTGAATINLGTGAQLAFTGGTVTWAGTLDITGTFVSGSSLNFGSSSGLSPAQLGAITLNGNPATFTLNGGGFLVTGGVSGYAAWQSANSTTQTADLDHDGDGISNGVEHFLFGTGDTTGNNNPLPGVVDTAGVLSVTWVRHPDFPGFPANYGSAVVVETSATLANPWTAVDEGVGEGFVEINGNNVKYTFPGGTKNFARLKVVTTP
jgi:autotransporter-associated beta strand protein